LPIQPTAKNRKQEKKRRKKEACSDFFPFLTGEKGKEGKKEEKPAKIQQLDHIWRRGGKGKGGKEIFLVSSLVPEKWPGGGEKTRRGEEKKKTNGRGRHS